MKERVRKEYYRRVRMVLKTELNAANRFEAINTLAIPDMIKQQHIYIGKSVTTIIKRHQKSGMTMSQKQLQKTRMS